MTSAETTAQLTGRRRLSIRWKVVIGFTVLFTFVYIIALNLFTNLAVDAADGQIQADLTQTMEGIANNVDADMVVELAATGVPNEAGFSDDPRFVEILNYLDEVHKVEPDAWPYVYIPHDTKEGFVYFVVDLYALYDPEAAGHFLEEYKSNSGWILAGLSDQVYRKVDGRIVQDIKNYAKSISESSPGLAETLTNFGDWLKNTNISPEKDFGTYGDRFGRWASGYMPLTNAAGEKVAAVGVDFKADYVNQVREEVSSQVRDAFLVSYPVLMVLVIVVTSLFTRPLLKLSGNAERIAEGDYEVDFSDLMKGRYKDEIDTLASVFEVMVDKVREREQTLKRQVAQLKIEIDESKKKSEVSEIVDTDFFKDLQSRASKLRDKRGGEEE